MAFSVIAASPSLSVLKSMTVYCHSAPDAMGLMAVGTAADVNSQPLKRTRTPTLSLRGPYRIGSNRPRSRELAAWHWHPAPMRDSPHGATLLRSVPTRKLYEAATCPLDGTDHGPARPPADR